MPRRIGSVEVATLVGPGGNARIGSVQVATLVGPGGNARIGSVQVATYILDDASGGPVAGGSGGNRIGIGLTRIGV